MRSTGVQFVQFVQLVAECGPDRACGPAIHKVRHRREPTTSRTATSLAIEQSE